MPIDLEMLLSATAYNFYPYTMDTTTYSENSLTRSLSFSHNQCRPRSLSRCHSFFHVKQERNVSNYELTPFDPTREYISTRKKKVSFADDKGFSLVEVCEIPGSPPKWADDVLTLLIGSTKRSVVKDKRWKVAFDHPPWPDEPLLDKLENNKVALEQVSVIEDSEDILHGSVKVKNLAFEKKVFLRVTFDRWLSYIDVPCSYTKATDIKSIINTYDTFEFSSKILPVAFKYGVIEFCICFQCEDREYWDNNGGINYRLTMDYSKSS